MQHLDFVLTKHCRRVAYLCKHGPCSVCPLASMTRRFVWVMKAFVCMFWNYCLLLLLFKMKAGSLSSQGAGSRTTALSATTHKTGHFSRWHYHYCYYCFLIYTKFEPPCLQEKVTKQRWSPNKLVFFSSLMVMTEECVGPPGGHTSAGHGNKHANTP